MEGRKFNNATSKTLITNMQEKLKASSESPFRMRYSFQTPPSKLASKVRNPFEPMMQERLHTHFMSPSVFARRTPKNEEKFKWTIDELSHMKPADIDEDVINTPEHDVALDTIAQSQIDKFFSMREIVPSPYTHMMKYSPLIKEKKNIDSISPPERCESSAQTVLTLPPELPRDLEEALQPFCTYTQDQQGTDTAMNTSLYRNLFDAPDDDCGSVESSPNQSIVLDLPPSNFSPISGGVFGGRTLPNKSLNDELKGCDLSPISFKQENKSAVRLNFSDHHMSIDTSFTVPDTSVLPDRSLESEDIKPLEQFNDSTVDWDAEYKKLDASSCSEMDVSNSNTPKSRKLGGQAKNLSDSFNKGSNEKSETVVNEAKAIVTKVIQDVTDAGYQTGCTFSDESNVWSISNIVASTPTKLKILNM